VRLRRDLEIATEAVIAAEIENKSRNDRIWLLNVERSKIKDEIGLTPYNPY